MGLVFPGDLDGDGKEEIALFERGCTPEDPSRLIVRRGVDGSVIAEFDLPHGYWTLGDLTGDGLSELITLDITTEDVGDDLSVGQSRLSVADQAVLQVIRAWSVADHKLLWQASFEGSIQHISLSDPGHSHAERARGILFDLFVEPDVSGDGKPDLFVHLRDTDTSSSNFVLPEYVTASESTHYGVSLDGATGSEVMRLETVRSDAEIVMLPMPDASGDGLGEIVTLAGPAYDEDWSVILSVYRADGGERYWEVDTGSIDLGWVRPFPLRSDDSTDLVYQASARDEVTRDEDEFVRGYSGADGMVLWEKADSHIEPVGDIDGHGGTDFVVNRSGSDRTTILAFDGESGEALWTRTIASPPDEQWLSTFSVCTGDHNGDGICDVMEIIRKGYSQGEDFVMQSLRRGAISGADGERIWFEEGNDQASLGGQLSPVPGVGDVTGNGTTDLAKSTIFPDAEATGRHADYQFAEGSNNSPAWGISTELAADESNPRLWGADFVNDDTAEVVLGIDIDGRSDRLFRLQVYDASGLIYEVIVPR